MRTPTPKQMVVLVGVVNLSAGLLLGVGLGRTSLAPAAVEAPAATPTQEPAVASVADTPAVTATAEPTPAPSPAKTDVAPVETRDRPRFGPPERGRRWGRRGWREGRGPEGRRWGRRGRRGPPGRGRRGRSHHFDRLAERLKLDAEQVKQVKAIFEHSRSRFRDVMKNVRSEMEAVRQEVDAEIKSVLRPEQVEAFEAMARERAERRHRKRKGRRKDEKR